MRKEKKRSPNRLLFYFSMKVLLLKPGIGVNAEIADNIYNNIVTQIRTNAVAMIPTSIKSTEVVDIDTVAFDNDGKFLFAPFRTEGGPNV